jgi:outer membrane immunogenic protein
MAADMPMRYAQPVAAPTWTGFYIGANAGGGIGKGESDFAFAGIPFATVDNHLSGAIGGGQAGYNWQTGAYVFGVEADIQASGVKGDLTAPCLLVCGLGITAGYEQKLTWFGTARGRLGYTQAGWLLYATGGYAYGRLETTASATAGAATASLGIDEIRSGWTVGGGVEVMLASNWSAKIEYLYMDLGKTRTDFNFGALPTLTDDARVNLNVVRAGINYRF